MRLWVFLLRTRCFSSTFETRFSFRDLDIFHKKSTLSFPFHVFYSIFSKKICQRNSPQENLQLSFSLKSSLFSCKYEIEIRHFHQNLTLFYFQKHDVFMKIWNWTYLWKSQCIYQNWVWIFIFKARNFSWKFDTMFTF